MLNHRLFTGKQETTQPSVYWSNFRKILVLLLIVAVFCLAPLGLKGWQKKSLVQNIRSHGGTVQFGHGNCIKGICSIPHPKLALFTGAISNISTANSKNFPINDAFIDSIGNQPHLQALTLGSSQNPSKITDRGLAALSKYPLSGLSIQGGSITNKGLKTLEKISTLNSLALHDLEFDIEEFKSSPLMKKLYSLSISGPQITDSDLAILMKAPLSSISINDSSISDSGFSVLTKCKLSHLTITNSDFTGENFEEASEMKILNRLNLSGSKITNPGLQKLSHISYLDYLDLSKTRIEGDGIRHLSKLKYLRSLRLNHLNIDADSLLYLADLDFLNRLTLEGASINDTHVQRIASLQQITFLMLLNSQVTDQGLISLASMQKLDRLFLANTQITDEGVKHLKHADSLVYLDLSNTLITDQAKESLLQIPQLIGVTTYGTKLSVATIQELRDAGLKVEDQKPSYLTE